jgi:hypothetical protein
MKKPVTAPAISVVPDSSQSSTDSSSDSLMRGTRPHAASDDQTGVFPVFSQQKKQKTSNDGDPEANDRV